MAKKLINTKSSLEEVLVKDLSNLIEKSKLQISYQANSALTLLFWNVGATINKAIL